MARRTSLNIATSATISASNSTPAMIQPVETAVPAKNTAASERAAIQAKDVATKAIETLKD